MFKQNKQQQNIGKKTQVLRFGLWYLMPLSTIFQLYRGC